MEVNSKNSIELSLFSKYRTELMGYAILGVLIAHFLMYTDHPVSLIAFLSRLVYTPGFLFLSGFGLYYSYSKDKDLLAFYKKRINRLYIPYVLMAFAFLFAHVLRHKENIVDFLAYITTIAFWYKGNYYGMWYVAVSLLLYFVYPIIHKFVFIGEKTKILLRGGIVLGLMCVLLALIFVCFPDVWKLIGIWINKVLMFPIGMIVGYYASKSIKIRLCQFSLYMVIMFVLLIMTNLKSIDFVYGMVRSLIGMPLMCICFYFMHERKYFTYVLSGLKWLGKYSLEIYLLHLFIYWSWYDIHPMNETFRYIATIVATLVLCKPVHIIIDKLQHSKYYLLR